MIKKIRLLSAIILVSGFFAISNLFVNYSLAMEQVKPVDVSGLNDVHCKQEWPKVSYFCSGDANEINAAARIEPGLFIRSVAVSVTKERKSGNFTCVVYERGRSGVLFSKKENDYSAIVSILKRIVTKFEKEELKNKKNN